MRVILCLLALAAVALASPVPFTPCSSSPYHITVTSIDVTPNPPQKGQPVKVTVTGNLNEVVSSGVYTIDAYYSGIKILTQSGDLCTLDPNFKCPIQPGSGITVADALDVPGFAPSGSYKIQVSATGSSPTDQLICVTVDMTIGATVGEEEPSEELPEDVSEESEETTEESEETVEESEDAEDDASESALPINDDSPAINHDMISYVNSLQTTWTAGVNNRFRGAAISHIKGLCGVLPGGPKLPENRALKYVSKMVDIPDAFDSREQWGDICPSTKDVRDQGACGSCWAFGAVEAMTDRICIASKGAQQPYLAAEDLVSCCIFTCGQGCQGGYPSAAWDYWNTVGIVTGGDYGSKQGCYPYQVPACDHHVVGKLPPCGDIQNTPKCTKTCQNNATFSQDKHFGSSSYSVPSDVSSIQTEIMTNGPVEAAFTVYEDFVSYKSGVYQHVSGQELGGHAIKILGWGTDNGTDYWWVANSWNADWGDSGFFKIRRGTDECGIEDGVVAGAPKL